MIAETVVNARIELKEYFRRIRYGAATSPNFRTLADILHAHVTEIPFENLDVLLGRGIRLDLGGLQDKLVRAHRGGYCFEHVTLLAAALEELGFRIACHSARVVLHPSAKEELRTHMFLTVQLPEGSFVLDPGFGSMASRTPVPLDETTQTPRGPQTRWMAREQNAWVLRTLLNDKWIDAWATTLERGNLADFESANHLMATDPNSPFVNRIMINAFTPSGRVSVTNRDVKIWRKGRVRGIQLRDRRGLRRLLNDFFGFDLPEVARLRVPSIPEWN